jgi:hypothetical protein
MPPKNKNLISKFIISAFMIFAVNVNLFSYIVHNGSGSGYEGGSGGSSLDTGKVSSIYTSIEGYIVEGAGYYLKANAGIQSLLNLVELQDMIGTDDAEMTRSVIDALDNITRARETFAKLIETAEATPYNPVVIEWLNHFDYNTFMTINNLNPVVFNELASYLFRGDITGTFKRTYAGICSIERLLTLISQELSENRVPGMTVFWELNERCAGASLFGSYAARVFQERNNIISK